MCNPVLLTLLVVSISLARDVSAPGTIKDLKPSPLLKPILADPHSMSPYAKNAKESCPSVANTTWNVFSYRECRIENTHKLILSTYLSNMLS